MSVLERTETYAQAKERHSKELNAFEGIFFAFSNDQFEEGLSKVGLNLDTYAGNIFKLPAGGFLLKSRSKAWGEMWKRQEVETKAARKSEKYLLESIVSELRNHEYCITYDQSDALGALGLSESELPKGMLKKACKKALEGFDE